MVMPRALIVSWAIQPEDSLGSAGFVDFDQGSAPPRFNWDRLDRDALLIKFL